MTLHLSTGFMRALSLFFAVAEDGLVAPGSGITGQVPDRQQIRYFPQYFKDGVSTGNALDVLTGWIDAPSDLDLDDFDPWFASLNDEQLALYRSRDLVRSTHGNLDLLAYYLPFHEMTPKEQLREQVGEPTWGIYLTTAGIEKLAREAFIPAGYSVDEALRSAARVLYAHEMFHFLTEVAITAVELAQVRHGAVVDHYLMHCRAHPSYCPVEEGLANRHVLRLVSEGDVVRPWMRSGPPGYQDFEDYEEPAAEQACLRDLLAHASGTTADNVPALAELAFDLGTHHIRVASVPLYVEVSAGSAFEAGGWSWEFLSAVGVPPPTFH